MLLGILRLGMWWVEASLIAVLVTFILRYFAGTVSEGWAPVAQRRTLRSVLPGVGGVAREWGAITLLAASWPLGLLLPSGRVGSAPTRGRPVVLVPAI